MGGDEARSSTLETKVLPIEAVVEPRALRQEPDLDSLKRLLGWELQRYVSRLARAQALTV